MEKFDLRELNKMVQQFRRCHKALNHLREEDSEFEIRFVSSWSSRAGAEIPIVDETKMRHYLISTLETEMARLRKKFGEMGIDPVDIDKRKKKKGALKVAQ